MGIGDRVSTVSECHLLDKQLSLLSISCADRILTMTTIKENKYLEKRKLLLIAFVGIEKEYDRVVQRLMWRVAHMY